jgi:hypothetical protein
MADWTSEDFDGSLLAGRSGSRDWPRPGRAALHHPLSALLATGTVLLLAALLAHRALAPSPGESLADPPARAEEPSWSPILRPVPGFVFETPLFPREQVTLAARRHHPGGGREDSFALAQPGARQGFGRLVVYRTGSEAAPSGTLYLELARRTAMDGFAILHSAQPGPLATKFGLVETADLVLSAGGAEYRCAAWRIVAEEHDLRVTGWLCPAQDMPMTRTALACLVDRLEVEPAQTDAALRALFVAADRRRTPGCPSPRPVPAGRRPA